VSYKALQLILSTKMKWVACYVVIATVNQASETTLIVQSTSNKESLKGL